jgi:putative nucleotidyltransferase with HDIG domain
MKLKEGYEFIDRIEELSAMPSIALDLMGMLNEPGSSVRTIVEKVQLDQAMISYILKTCNSPLFGVRTQVTSISMAINLLGFSNLKSILMSYFMRNLYQLSGKNEIKNLLWKHSISVAFFSKNLSPKVGTDPDEAYLAGLLHDVGKMVLYLDNPVNYAKVIYEVDHNKKGFIESENELFQFSHADAGFFLMEKWKFSDLLKDVALHHHDCDPLTDKGKIISIVCFANELSHTFLENRVGDIDKFLGRFRFTEKELDNVVNESQKMIDSYTAIL